MPTKRPVRKPTAKSKPRKTTQLKNRSKFSWAKASIVIVPVVILLGFLIIKTFAATSVTPAAVTCSTKNCAFTFVAWGDTKNGTSHLANLSKQAAALNPKLTLFSGDECDSGFTTTCIATWKNALNGNVNNNMFTKTFAVRGNHDSSNVAGWQSYFNFSGTATAVGAKNFTAQSTDLTYSFDYNNSHFVGIDVPGDSTILNNNPTVLAWLNTDLTNAENRGLTHSFIFMHGPIYPVGEHCCSVYSPNITAVLNGHRSVSAVFNGHEHLFAYDHMTATRMSNITHPFEQFIIGNAGADSSNNCTSHPSRWDYCAPGYNFGLVSINGKSFTVKYYAENNPNVVKSWTFTKP